MYNHVTHIERTDNKTTLHVEPIGDERREIEQAAKRAFNGATRKVRASLIASGYAELNPAHAHSGTYADIADSLTVERSTFTDGRGLEMVEVTIEEN